MSKKCSKCKQFKPVNEFHKDRYKSDGLSSSCKLCKNKYNRSLDFNPDLHLLEKKCKKCNQLKSISNFYKSRRNLDGYNYNCKQCDLKIRKIYRNSEEGTFKTIYDGIKRRSKKKNYQMEITIADIKLLYKNQEGKCAISGILLDFKEGHDIYNINPFAISVDRIDSSMGYLKENIQLVCSWVNFMKSEYSDTDFRLMISKIYKHYIQ